MDDGRRWGQGVSSAVNSWPAAWRDRYRETEEPLQRSLYWMFLRGFLSSLAMLWPCSARYCTNNSYTRMSACVTENAA